MQSLALNANNKISYHPEKELTEGFNKYLEEKAAPATELMKAIILCHNTTVLFDKNTN